MIDQILTEAEEVFSEKSNRDIKLRKVPSDKEEMEYDVEFQLDEEEWVNSMVSMDGDIPASRKDEVMKAIAEQIAVLAEREER